MRPGLHSLCMLASVLTPVWAYAEEPQLEPLQLVRSLQLVQDRVAVGDHAALPIQKKLLEMVDARLRAAPAETLSTPGSLRALMLYAISGGNPETFGTITRGLQLGEHDSRLALGILAYLQGSSKAASQALAPIEPVDEPPEIAGPLALVKGSVTALEDPTAALKLLDEARLLSPGTLVEEAALRRSIALATSTKDATRLVRAADQYARAYIRSPYASQFADALVNGVVALHDTVDLAHIDETTLLMTPEQRRVIYLRIARRAAIEGLMSLSSYAAGKAGSTPVPATDADDPRLPLYTLLTTVATEPPDSLNAKLDRIDRGRLSPGDQDLYDAVRSVANQIEEPPVQLAAGDTAADVPQGETPLVVEAPKPDAPADGRVADARPQAGQTAPAAPAPPPAINSSQPPNVATGSEDLGVPATAGNVASGAAAPPPPTSQVREIAPPGPAPGAPPAATQAGSGVADTVDPGAGKTTAEASTAAPPPGEAPPTEARSQDSQDSQIADQAMLDARAKLAEIDKLLSEAKQ